MKRRVLIIFLAIVFCLSLALVACNTTHECKNKCPECQKCLNKDCKEDACKDKCQGHQTQTHVCGHVCPTCGKCLDASCTDAVCADKCQGHGDPVNPVKVTSVIITGYDEAGNDNNDGTIEAPFIVSVPQGHEVELGFNVRPTNATNKELDIAIGAIENGEFKADASVNKLTAVIDSRIKLTAAADLAVGGGIVVEVKAKDGSNVATYLAISVTEYAEVTGITAANLKASEDELFDYEIVTAVNTNWAIESGITKRGQDLLDGNIFGGKQAPLNLTYFANVYNLGLKVEPENATEPDYSISYSVNDVVEVSADGALTVKKAGETVITVTSDSNEDVSIKIKVTVQDSLYRGVLLKDYTDAQVVSASSWNLDPGDDIKGSEAHMNAYRDWRIVMIHSNLGIGKTGDDNNQKAFYMGSGEKPYGISLENNVGSSSGGSLLDSASLIWSKLTVPQSAITFNVKLNNNDKTHGQYRVVFIDGETKQATVLTDGENGWCGFASQNMPSFTVKCAIPQAIKGRTGAMVVEHRVTEASNNAELHIYTLGFEGQVDVESVVFNRNTAEYKTGVAREITNVQASVTPDNATNDKVVYSIHPEDADKGVTVNANTGVITVSESAAAGNYRIIAASVANENITATFTLTLTADEIEVNEWKNKTDILSGVADVKWDVIGNIDMGVGEGADLNCNGGRDWSAISLKNREVKSSSFILTFGARVFHRDGETYPHFIVKVIEDGQEAVVIKGIGQEHDYFYVDTDATQYCSYDLSAYIGKTVEIQIGIDRGTHAVIQSVKFTGSETKVTVWNDKTALLDSNGDPWTVVGDTDSGVGEGVDIQHTDSYIHNSFVIGSYNAKFTFGARVFVRGGETYPDIKVIVKAGEDETLVRAIGVNSDTVHVESDNVLPFSYDLSAFIGKQVEIRIQLANNATHCVIANAKLEQQEIIETEPEAKIGETGYDTLADAIAAANNGDVIVLQKDLDLNKQIVLGKSVVLDMNGKTIANSQNIYDGENAAYGFFALIAGGNLTVKGNGSMLAKEGDCYAISVWDKDSKLVIENGTFKGNSHCIYVYAGIAELKGGEYSIFEDAEDGYKFTLNLYDANGANGTAKIVVTGGSYVNYDPSHSNSEAPEADFVAQGYEVSSAVDGEDTIYTVTAKEQA